MYLVLVGEQAKKKITNRAIAKVLGTHENTVSNKLNGGQFTINEAISIRDAFFPDYKIEELFKTEHEEEKEEV